MPFRLKIDHAGTIRYENLDAETIVGSGSDAELRLVDPGVSRRHAALRVDGEEVKIEDLGSLNGTEVDGRRLQPRTPTTAPIGCRIKFGPVQAQLESAEASDAVIAIAFEPPAEEVTRDGRGSPTVGAGDLHRFLLRRLPEVLTRIRRRPGWMVIAGLVGEAVFDALPALGLRILGEDGGLAYRAGDPEAEGSRVIVGSPTTVEAVFPEPEQAQTFRPLLEVAAHLVALDESDPIGVAPSPDRPALSDPPTLNPRLRRIYEEAGRVARGNISVLILGESGTGKELLARYLHAASGRTGELVTLNAAALPHDLLEAELFGVEKGVATGVDARPGKFEVADGGTLFLDEIGDMQPAIQAKLLRVLEGGELVRVGARTTRHVDVRVVSASNRDLDQLRKTGGFRDDLYHRIADWRVEMPALRERRVDIPNLAAFFLWRQARIEGVRPAGLAESAVETLEAYHWPGNVRQLEREMARVALFLDDGQLLQRAHLSAEIRTGAAAPPLGETLELILDRAERVAILAALGESDWDTAATAERLGISRSTLYRRMEKHGLGEDRRDPDTSGSIK